MLVDPSDKDITKDEGVAELLLMVLDVTEFSDESVAVLLSISIEEDDAKDKVVDEGVVALLLVNIFTEFVSEKDDEVCAVVVDPAFDFELCKGNDELFAELTVGEVVAKVVLVPDELGESLVRTDCMDNIDWVVTESVDELDDAYVKVALVAISNVFEL